MTKYTADEVREAINATPQLVTHDRGGTMLDTAEYQKIRWAASEYLKTTDPRADTFCKGCEGYQKEIAELVRK